jgi:hypothetical protein
MGQTPAEKNERMGERPDEHNERTGERAGEKNEHAGGGKSVELSSDQKTRLKAVVGHDREARVDRPDFSVSVGTRIPRSVHVVVLPEDIVQIVPEYRGYKYVIVHDEIVILDPDTLEIVAILPA